MRLHLCAAASALLLLSTCVAGQPAYAQAVPDGAYWPDGTHRATGAGVIINPNGGSPCVVGAAGCPGFPRARATTTTTNGAVATAGVFQIVLAANANRLDCTIYSSSAFSVAAGTSPVSTQAIPVAAGGTFKCSSAVVTMTDQINITSAVQGAAYVVWAQ